MKSTGFGGAVKLYSSPRRFASDCTSKSLKYHTSGAPSRLYRLATKFSARSQLMVLPCANVLSFFKARHSRMAPAAKGLRSMRTKTSSRTHSPVAMLKRSRTARSISSWWSLRDDQGSAAWYDRITARRHMARRYRRFISGERPTVVAAAWRAFRGIWSREMPMIAEGERGKREGVAAAEIWEALGRLEEREDSGGEDEKAETTATGRTVGIGPAGMLVQSFEFRSYAVEDLSMQACSTTLFSF
mmetsp:Transcript_25114/g.45505  ORF Transcript_25114/g.45505 Transcript_25114/m.45505 type:complete len:244 (+) Transcript_25114:876-1607(+)